jgi:hypothetical protein
MRYLVCLLGGALIGALIAVTVANILRQRDAWPRAVMTVMQHELARARDLVQDGRCSGPEAASAAAHLELLAADIEPAVLGPDAHDRVFSRYAADLRNTIASFEAAGECTPRRQALTALSDACEACHRDYR